MKFRYDHALIIGSGEDVPEKLPSITSATFVICADGGARHALSWGIAPHLIIGDMDSIDQSTMDHWQKRNVPIENFPIEKDKTDVELAIDRAFEFGVRRITLVGVWGDRVDHSLSNATLLYRVAKQGAAGELITKTARLIAFQNSFTASVQPGTVVSLLPLTPAVHGITTEGLYYPLKQEDLYFGSTRGISNNATDVRINISCSAGILLIVLQT